MTGSNPTEKEAIFEEAISLRDKGDFEGACRVFSVFIEKFPDDPVGYYMKGAILLSLLSH